MALVVDLPPRQRLRHSELGAHPDEAAHFVTGLMVRDYLASGFHESPLRYADEYYRHYPKIGLGVWPPFFYLVQAVWTLVFPAGVATVLRLMIALGLALALVTGGWLWREFGWVEAVTGAVLLMALPLVQQYSNMVMAEMLSALLMFGAAGYFARYLEGEEWRGAAGLRRVRRAGDHDEGDRAGAGVRPGVGDSIHAAVTSCSSGLRSGWRRCWWW